MMPESYCEELLFKVNSSFLKTKPGLTDWLVIWPKFKAFLVAIVNYQSTALTKMMAKPNENFEKA